MCEKNDLRDHLSGLFNIIFQRHELEKMIPNFITVVGQKERGIPGA